MNHGNQLSQSMQPESSHRTVGFYLCIFVVDAKYTEQQVLQNITYSKNYTPCHYSQKSTRRNQAEHLISGDYFQTG